MTKVLIKRLNSNVELPTYKTKGASGMDLMACIQGSIKIPPKTADLVTESLSSAAEPAVKTSAVFSILRLFVSVLLPVMVIALEFLSVIVKPEREAPASITLFVESLFLTIAH